LKSRIILLGPPASGKGTQAEMLAAKYGYPSASTGAFLREERARGTEIGREADAWTSRGMYFPDEIALRVIEQWLAAHGIGKFILDGFPRTLPQAKAFDELLARLGLGVDVVFDLQLPDGEIHNRVANRITCTHCGASFSMMLHGVKEGDSCPSCGMELVRRRDDTAAALGERLEQHRVHTGPVIAYYRETGRLVEVDASIGRDHVFEKLCECIEEAVPA